MLSSPPGMCQLPSLLLHGTWHSLPCNGWPRNGRELCPLQLHHRCAPIPAVHSEPCGPWLCRELGTWRAAATHIVSLLKSRVQMLSPYPAEGWRGLFCFTPECECLVVPHPPSSGRLGAGAPQAWPGAPGGKGTLLGCQQGGMGSYSRL